MKTLLRAKEEYRKMKRKAMAVGFLLGLCLIAYGETWTNGYSKGLEDALNDCYGLPCEQYTLIIGQASKEARQTKKTKAQIKPTKVASVFDVLNEK